MGARPPGRVSTAASTVSAAERLLGGSRLVTFGGKRHVRGGGDRPGAGSRGQRDQQSGGASGQRPPVVLTVGGLIIGGTIIPDWQWFDEVEQAARAAFTVHTRGSIDDEHGGWARLLRGARELLVRDREEHRAAQNVMGSVRALPPGARLGGPHHLHSSQRCPGARFRCQPSAPRRDALAGTAVGGLGVVLRTPWRAVTGVGPGPRPHLVDPPAWRVCSPRDTRPSRSGGPLASTASGADRGVTLHVVADRPADAGLWKGVPA